MVMGTNYLIYYGKDEVITGNALSDIIAWM